MISKCEIVSNPTPVCRAIAIQSSCHPVIFRMGKSNKKRVWDSAVVLDFMSQRDMSIYQNVSEVHWRHTFVKELVLFLGLSSDADCQWCAWKMKTDKSMESFFRQRNL